MSLTREEILGARKPAKLVKVQVPAWNGSVFVKELTSEEMDAFEAHIGQMRQKALDDGKEYRPNVRGSILAECICDEKGIRLFQPSDAADLGKWVAHELEPVVNECDKINHFTKVHQANLEKKYAVAGGGGLRRASPGNPGQPE